MPVILTTPTDVETWMTAPWLDARRLQRTAPDDALVIVDKPATQIKFPQADRPAQGSLF
jgi:putative SOS response-associated peptidase YedK